MAHAQEIYLQIRGAPGQEEEEPANEESREGPEPAARRPKPNRRRGVRWWALVMADTLMLLSGEAVAPLLGRFYYNSGGGSMWMKTLVQSAGAPLLVVPLLLTPRAPAGEPQPAASKVAAVCVGLGLVSACDNLMYWYGLLYLPVSTFSLVAATQLAFNAVTSRLINAQQRFTAPILNSVVVVTFSAVLLGVGDEDEASSTGTGTNIVPRGKHALGFVITLSASAVYALVLSLFEVAFEKVIKVTTLRWVLMVQLCTDTVASMASVAGLFASGEWRMIRREMTGFKNGSTGYVATMAGIAVGWQAATLGAVRLITRASSLFANVSGTLALPLVPVFAVALFGDKMTGIKAVAMLMAVWGFLSYVYQHYLDDRRAAVRKPEGENGG